MNMREDSNDVPEYDGQEAGIAVLDTDSLCNILKYI
jgi:hypothetical protein